jgi:hypothetical protein
MGLIAGSAVPCIGVGSATPIHFTVSLLTGNLSSSSVDVAFQAVTADKANHWHPTYSLRVPAGEYTLVASPEGPATGVSRGAVTFAEMTLTWKQRRSPPFSNGAASWGYNSVSPVHVHADRMTRLDTPQCN